jgi:dipeptidyl aminopeptidase/acylaminoacyl peptidase
VPPDGGDAGQVTDLPIDVDAFRVSPTGDRIALSMSVFRDCADLACTKAKADAKEKDKASGQVYDRLFVRHWDTWADGRNAVLYSAPLDATAASARPGQPVRLAGRRRALEAFRRPRGIPLQPGRQDRRVLGAHRRQDRSLVDQLRPVFGAVPATAARRAT